MEESITKYLLEDITHEPFTINILCKECNQPCGLVRGGLTGKPRMYCFNEEEIKDSEEIEVEVV